MSLDIEWPRYPTDTGPTDISSPDIPEAESGFFVDYEVFDDVIGPLQREADALNPGNPPDSRPDNLRQWRITPVTSSPRPMPHGLLLTD
ncbi:hypothetical protein Airi02_041890 [Actinoallomurus iriomotensis]|uniref:Uncharacterized protein n=1 Tax=Actinoallomurus iriomotensis TaxID=478107 RepID=A0A9W6S6G9_9ACTN|nr:hypothetical protein Airi02_041890 [Actinoallomurus iriomotensis]